MAKTDCRDCSDDELKAWMNGIIQEEKEKLARLQDRFYRGIGPYIDPDSYDHYMDQALDSIEYWESELANVGKKNQSVEVTHG